VVRQGSGMSPEASYNRPVPGSGASQWLAITYREFYDIPRTVLVEYEGDTYLLDCPFDERADAYPDEFAVYSLPEATAKAAREPTSSWIDLAKSGTFRGRVPVEQVRFDESRRRFLDSEVFRFLGN
jgi:hypothetical protein